MKKLIVLLCSLALLPMSGLTWAGHETGFFIGGSGGRTDFKVKTNVVDFHDNDTGYKAFVGYNFGVIPLLNLGVEASYIDFGSASSSTIFDRNVDLTGWDAFGVVGLNLGPIGLFAKAGQIWWDADAHLLNTSLKGSGNDMAYGAGALFQIGSLGIRAEYEYFDIEVSDVGFASVGLSWTF